jgi:predicted amidohydrolase
MKVALAQVSSRLGDIDKNLERHIYFVEKARRKKANLVVFPELSLTGYTLMDLVADVALNPGVHPVFKELKVLSRGIDLVVGFVEEKEKGIFYNSAAYLTGGRIAHIHRKVFLPTFGMFEEARFFGQGRSFRPFDTRFGRAGLMICRDFLSYGASYLLFAGGSDLIIVVSAAPGRGFREEGGFVTSRMWELMGEAISYFSTAFVIYTNRVGFEDGKAFAGGSFVFNPKGQLIARASDIDEEMLLADLRLDELREIRKRWTFKRDDRPEIILHALEEIVSQHED